MSANYVYIRSEPGLWTVGFYDPDGRWQSDSDHDSPEAAAERVGALNGNDEGYPGIAHDFETMKALLERALPAVRAWAGMVRRSSGHHSAKSAAADNLVHDIRTALRAAGGEL